jgi:hypothetical protein
MSGTDKHKHWLLGEGLKGNSRDSLPVLYYANKNVWMTSETFKKWMSWDVELQWKSKKILLILNDCTAYPQLDYLKNIQQ